MADDELKRTAEARLGRVLRGKYRLDRVLGIGGMATVYAATHRNKKRFAIKMLHPELSIRENIRTRFLREGYVANTVDHPGAVAVLDDDVAEDGSAFIVMELLSGAPVDEVAAKYDRHVPLPIVVSIGDALLDVLAAAHAKGVVHRDLKPANLFLTSDGRLEVLDFGIARLHDETSEARHATQTGAMLGTPAFMAPEQALAESSKVDGQTDLWAVGATLFTLLTGELVHAGENASQLLVGAATKKARSITTLAPDVPKAIADVIDKALSFEKADRWPGAKAMREALAKACVEATGAPIAPLPKTEKVTGLEETIASTKDFTPASSGAAFDATVSADAAAASATPVATTGAGVASTRESALPRRPARRIPWPGIGVAVVGCVAVAGSAAAYRAAHAPRVRYCLDTEDTNDGPRCVFEVGADIVGKRSSVVTRVTERAGKVVLVEHINFAGRVTGPDIGDWSPDFARVEITRDDAGAVRDVVTYDRFGPIIEWQKWSEGGKRIDFVDLDGKTPRHRSGDSHVTSERLDYDAEGRPTRALFFGPTGRPRASAGEDTAGAYGLAWERGKTPGIFTKRTTLGADGAVAPNAYGVVFTRRADDGSFWADTSFFDANDRPIAPKGVHTARLLHDDYEETGEVYLGLHGEPVTSLLLSIHEARQTWDPLKRVVEVNSFDEKGRPQPVRLAASGGDVGLQCWIWRVTYDDRGRGVRTENLDSQGNRMVGWNGAAAMRFAYDEHDHRTLMEGLDLSGAVALRIESKRDAHDNSLERRTYDETGHLAPSKWGPAIERRTFDDRDLLLTSSAFDADDHPVANRHGFASEHDRYDRLRNLVEVAYFGPDGRPTASDEGFATKRMTYDENDDLVATSYFDANGAPTPFQSSYATQRLKNDERGLVVEEDYLDVHGDPVLVKDGYASVKSTRDRNGDVVDEAYLGKHGEPIVRDGGFARRTTSHDVTRRPIEIALFDAAGQPVKGDGGWAVERTTYDERGLVVRIDHLDATKAPALDGEGRASLAKAWDSRGNPTEETSLDAAGKPVATPGGFATKKTTYDDRDQVTEEALLGADGKPVSGKAGWSLHRFRYDDFGDVVEEAFFDGAHEAVVPKELTYSSKRQRFDERHRLVESTYLDVRGTPTKGPDGAAVVRFKRDGYGRAVETAYLDGTGEPAASKDGRLVVRSKFDDAGRLVDERFVDAAGAPRAAADGCSGRHTKFDAQGHVLEESCLDAKDGPTPSTDGWAVRRTLHDARGNDVDVATYAPDGTLHVDKDGVARRKNRFDGRNLLLETAYFDASDKPAHDKRGVTVVRFTYDDAGKKTGEASFDVQGRPVTAKLAAR